MGNYLSTAFVATLNLSTRQTQFMLAQGRKVIIIYAENYCEVTNRQCDRGSVKECPERKFNLEVPCSHFKELTKEES